MASTKKSKTGSKRFSKVSEDSPEKDGNHANKSRLKKRRLSDALGSQWSKEELERFYDAYRKYGKDWKKVASVVRNMSIDMVEALYNMNRAYLSLPEGTASVAGLIAMMTDHYNLLEGSDSERESNDGLAISRKPQKRQRGKFNLNSSEGSKVPFLDLLQCQPVSSYGCLSLFKKPRSGGCRPCAVGKRTPRYPVAYPHVKDGMGKLVSQSRQCTRSDLDADDDVAHAVALTLAEASHRGGSPQVSRTPSRTEWPSPVPNGERKHAELEMVSAKGNAAAMDEDCIEGSVGSREAENGDFSRDNSYPMDTEGNGAVKFQQKVKKFPGKKPKDQRIDSSHFDDVREACSGTEEGVTSTAVKDEFDSGATNGKLDKPAKGPRKRRQLLFQDESFALDALHALADLSVNILSPAATVDSESSVRVKEEKRNIGSIDKPNVPGAMPTNHQRDTSRNKLKGQPSTIGDGASVLRNATLADDISWDGGGSPEAKQQPVVSNGKMRKRKCKTSVAKLLTPTAEVHTDSHVCESKKNEALAEEGRKSVSKAKRSGNLAQQTKQSKPVKSPELSFSNTEAVKRVSDLCESRAQSPVNTVNLPTKVRSRHKMDIQKALQQRKFRSSESIGNEQTDEFAHSVHNKAVELKKKICHCLSSQLLRKWCTYEWFYSAIDYPWFARSEFVEYLNHVGLGHIPRLTRVEWGVIRSSLGKPRRLSEQFLREEREKLEQYRESVRIHYTELRSGVKDGLATDLARPLSVGQHVIAFHPKRREIHGGSVLTVERDKCRVHFECSDLGVKFIKDIDCMPTNPSENFSEVCRRQNSVINKAHDNSNDVKSDVQPKELKVGGSVKPASSENLEIVDGPSHATSSTYPMSTLMKQAKGDTLDDVLQAKATANEVISAQATHAQPSTLAQIQAREADIRALSDLKLALDKKELLLLELRHMNDEELGNRKDGDPIKDENFRKHYAMILVQLKDTNEQVGAALNCLRQRNTYNGNTNSAPTWLTRHVANLEGSVGALSPFECSMFANDSGPHVVEIVENSKWKAGTMVAGTMVDAAMQALSLAKEEEDTFVRIGDALDSASIRHPAVDYCLPDARSSSHKDSGRCGSVYLDQPASCTSESVDATHIRQDTSGGNVSQHPSELISSCVATLLMIQTCTERQYPPAEVARILDSAVTSLQPCCSQNLPIFRDIEQCMRHVKSQVLSLIPTQATVLLPEISM